MNDKTGTFLKSQESKIQLENFSVFSNNCVGAEYLRKLGIKYNSPFVGLFVSPSHYVEILNDLSKFMTTEPREVFNPEYNYPLGQIEDVVIHFVHYASFKVAKDAWIRRSRRIVPQKIFSLMVDIDQASQEDLKNFLNVSYGSKLILTNREFPELANTFRIIGCEKNGQLGDITQFQYKSIFRKQRYMDQFDFVAWVNGNSSLTGSSERL